MIETLFAYSAWNGSRDRSVPYFEYFQLLQFGILLRHSSRKGNVYGKVEMDEIREVAKLDRQRPCEVIVSTCENF